MSNGNGASDETGPIVRLAGGALRGERIDGIERFLGIRYGEDTASRRFRRAEPARPWTGTRDALSFGNECPQPVFPGGPVYDGMEIRLPASEDCLFLSITTPPTGDARKRPVLVWLHGGGFVMGSGAARPYDGTRLVTRGDVVLVSITHRLNLFGHIELKNLLGDSFAEASNVGMLDIVLALEWVRDNIAAFGGDPANVTVFGESGGGAKVHTLLAMPEARGLFHRAAIQSGGGGLAITPEEAAHQPEQLLAALGLGLSDAAQLLTLPTQALTDAFTATFAPARFPWSRPVIDGHVLPRHPFYPDAPAISSNVPLMIGTTRTEATGLLGAFFPDLFDLTWDGLEAALPPFLAEWGIYDTVPGVASDPAAVIAAFRANMPDASPPDVLFLAASWAMFIRGAIRTAEVKAAAGSANAYLWSLDWATPVDGGKWGAPHALDVPLFFDTVATAPAMLGADTSDPQRLADQMSGALIAFARTGDPNHPGLPHWPPYDATTRATMIFDLEPKVEQDPRRWARELFAPDA